MKTVDSHWTNHNQHGELLRSFREVGGLTQCPQRLRKDLLHWLVITYIGVPGGVTQYGHVRHVFYSDTAAPLIRQIIEDSADLLQQNLVELRREKEIRERSAKKHIARRFEALLDNIDAKTH